LLPAAAAAAHGLARTAVDAAGEVLGRDARRPAGR
jgi:hypothetical protein